MDTTSPPASASGRSIGLRNWRVRSKLIAVLVIPAVTAYREAEAPLYEDLGEGVQGRFDAVRAGLADLALLRQSTRASSLTGRATSAEYSQIIDQLIDVNAEIAEPGGDEDLAQSVRALDDLSRAKEVTSQIRGILYALSFRDDFAFGGFQEFSSLLARQQAAFNQFQADANNQQRALFADVVQGQAVLQVDQIQQTTIRTQSGENINGPQWLAASTTNLELLRNVERGDLDVRVEPIGIDSRDEIGQVAAAGDAIQEVAVRLASEQAALRRSIGDMFTN